MNHIAHSIKPRKNLSDDVKLNKKAAFSKMLLSEEVLKGITNAGFIYPTMIQASAIPMGKAGIDLIIQSKSGTGKTLIFSIIILENYHYETPEPQALVLVPSREIAVQIADVVNAIGKFCRGFRAVSVIGGLNITDDRKRLQGAKVIIGTPGRATHLIKNCILNTSQIKLFVLDEADKLYSESFYDDILYIQKSLPAKKQTIASSATFCGNLEKEITRNMKNAILISNEDKTPILLGLKQYILDLSPQKTSILEMQEKINSLCQVFSRIPFKQCIVYVSSQSRAESYCNNLQKRGWSCELITGSQIQIKRIETFYKLREFKMRILVATDVWSRGIDSDHVDLVINLDLPSDIITYYHRIGRAGRFGSKGISIGFVSSENDHLLLKEIIAQCGGGINIYKISKQFEQESDNPDLIQTIHLNYLRKKLYSNLLEDSNNKTKDIKEIKEIIKSCNFSIGLKTFVVDSNENAVNLLAAELGQNDLNTSLPNIIWSPESVQSSSHLPPSSNTIDDASSIAIDSSQSECSCPQGNYFKTFKNVLTPDAHKPFERENSDKNKLVKNTKKKIDIFEDFINFMESEPKSAEINSIIKSDATINNCLQNYPKDHDTLKKIQRTDSSKNAEQTYLDYTSLKELQSINKNFGDISDESICNDKNNKCLLLSLSNEHLDNLTTNKWIEKEENESAASNEEYFTHATRNKCQTQIYANEGLSKNSAKNSSMFLNKSPEHHIRFSEDDVNITVAQARWMNIYCNQIKLMHEYLNFV